MKGLVGHLLIYLLLYIEFIDMVILNFYMVVPYFFPEKMEQSGAFQFILVPDRSGKKGARFCWALFSRDEEKGIPFRTIQWSAGINLCLFLPAIIKCAAYV